MTLTGGKPIGYQIPMLLGAHAGAVVTTIAVTSSGKTAGLSLTKKTKQEREFGEDAKVGMRTLVVRACGDVQCAKFVRVCVSSSLT